jgi:hypothetical protein
MFNTPGRSRSTVEMVGKLPTVQPKILEEVAGGTRPAIIAESQPALKFRVNRPRPRSQPARAGRACVLVVYFFSRQLGQL